MATGTREKTRKGPKNSSSMELNDDVHSNESANESDYDSSASTSSAKAKKVLRVSGSDTSRHRSDRSFSSEHSTTDSSYDYITDELDRSCHGSPPRHTRQYTEETQHRVTRVTTFDTSYEEIRSRKPLHHRKEDNIRYQQKTKVRGHEPLSEVVDNSFMQDCYNTMLNVGKKYPTYAFLLVVLLCLLFYLVVSSLFSFSSVHSFISVDSRNESLKNALVELKKNFPSQSSRFWLTLQAGIKSSLLSSNPHQPAVFLISVPSDARELARCFVNRFSSAISSALHSRNPVVFGPVSGNEDPHVIKKQLDDAVRGGFDWGSRVAILHEINRLHGESAMMLHGLCDTENAPYKNVVYLLSMFVDETSDRVVERDSFLEDKLFELWKNHIISDSLYPLLSRIGNAIVYLKNESKNICS